MAYSDDIEALLPNYLYLLQNNYTEEINGATGSGASGTTFVTTPICADSVYSMLVDGASEGMGLPSGDINGGGIGLCVGGWFQLDTISIPSIIWAQGGGSNNFLVSLANGNALLCTYTITTGGSIYEEVALDVKLEVGRPYHIMFQWNQLEEVYEVYLNGVRRNITTITDPVISHGSANIAEGGSYAQDTSSVTYRASPGLYSHWAAWVNKYVDPADIRTELFEKGAIETTSQVFLQNLVDNASAGLFLISAVGGAITAEIDTLLKAYSFEDYFNLEFADNNQNVSGSYQVTLTTPVRARVVKYGFSTFQSDLALDRLNNFLPYFLLTDPKTTESTLATVQAYTDITTTARLYDFARQYDAEFPEYGFDIFRPNGTTMDGGDLDITIDQNALRSVTIQEDTLTPTDVYDDERDALGAEDLLYFFGDSTNASDYTRTAVVTVVAHVTIPSSSPDGGIWFLGGTGIGGGICFTSGELVVRAGDGASATEPNMSRVSIDVSASGEDLLGREGLIIYEADPSTDTVSVWWQDFTDPTIAPRLLGTDTSSVSWPSGTWAGTGAGNVGTSFNIGGETTNGFNGGIIDVRVWDSTSFSLTSATTEVDFFSRGPSAKSWPMELTVNRASVTGTQSENFSITGSSNDALKLTIDGGTSLDVTLTAGTRTAAQVAADIQAAADAAFVPLLASDDSGSVKIESILPQGGTGSSVEIETVANNAYTTLGFTVGTTTAGRNTLSVRSLTAIASSAAFDTIATTGSVTIEDGTTINGLDFDAEVVLETAQNLTNVTIDGDLRINTGANSTLSFSNVTVTGLVYNDDASHTLTINASNSSLTAGDPGTGNGQTNVVSSVPVTITVVTTTGTPIENARVFLETTPGGVDIFDGSDGTSLTDSNGEVSASYAGTTPANITGRARKSSTSPYYKTGIISGQVTASGFSATIVMVLDE